MSTVLSVDTDELRALAESMDHAAEAASGLAPRNVFAPGDPVGGSGVADGIESLRAALSTYLDAIASHLADAAEFCEEQASVAIQHDVYRSTS